MGILCPRFIINFHTLECANLLCSELGSRRKGVKWRKPQFLKKYPTLDSRYGGLAVNYHPPSLFLFFHGPSPPISLLPIKPTGDPFLTRGCVWVLPDDFIFNILWVRRQLGAEQLKCEQSWIIRFPAAFFFHPPLHQSAALSRPLLAFIPRVVFVNLQISLRTIP